MESFLPESLGRAKNGGGGNRTRDTSLEEPCSRAKNRVYFIQAGHEGPIKVGIARDPQARLQNLQVGNHLELVLLAVSAPLEDASLLERYLHQTLSNYRVRNEWFFPCAEVLAAIEEYKYVAPTPPPRPVVVAPHGPLTESAASIIRQYGSLEDFERIKAIVCVSPEDAWINGLQTDLGGNAVARSGGVS